MKAGNVLWITADQPRAGVVLHASSANVGEEVDIVLTPACNSCIGIDADNRALGRRTGPQMRTVGGQWRTLRHFHDRHRNHRHAHVYSSQITLQLLDAFYFCQPAEVSAPPPSNHGAYRKRQTKEASCSIQA